jgi:hypothetical protein
MCLKLSMVFHEMKSPGLEDVLEIQRKLKLHDVQYSIGIKKWWVGLQARVLDFIQWKLHFPTGGCQIKTS